VRRTIGGAGGNERGGGLALRRRDAGFAAAWRAALESGYDRIEAALICRALGEAGDDGAAATGAIDVNVAMLLLGRRPGAAAEAAKTAVRFRAPRDAAEAALLAKLKLFEKRLAARGQAAGGGAA